MMHANQQWHYKQPNNNAYGVEDDDDDEEDDATTGADFGVDSTTSGRRYLTVQPKQWCTSYVANRQHYIHSTESAANHNGGIGGGTGLGLDNDVYSGVGGRSSTDFFRSKTMPRRTGAPMMDDYNYGNGNDSDGNATAATDGPRTGVGGRHQWPTSSADIAEYDSSVVADTPTLQQQHTQFLLPHQHQQQQQQQQRLRTNNNNKFSQNPSVPPNSNAGYAGKAAIATAGAEDSANGGQMSKAKWKTRALYVFLACLLAVVVINLTLTLWFIRVTQFTSEGMGSMKITQGGLRLSGRTLVTDRLVATAIRSRANRPLLIESAANITLNARNSHGRLLNSLKLTKDGLECAQANVFQVTDTRGETLFSADRNKVIVGARELHVTGSGGAVFQGSVQTPMVRADSRHDLRLESASRKLELRGNQGVIIESRAGDISVSCLMDLKLQSLSGAIQIDAAKVIFKGLKTAKMTSNPVPRPAVDDVSAEKSTGQQNSVGRTFGDGDDGGGGGGGGGKKRGVELPRIYQLCVCGNGKVFLSPPDGQCAADGESGVCR